VSTMSRVPIRLTYNNSYYNELYQGIPAEGYTEFINRLLRGADIRLGVNYLDDREALRRLGDTVIFTGAIDSYFDYCFGRLDYQAVGFQDVYHANTDNFQGNAVVNYPDAGVPYTRSIEHRHFVPTDVPGTIVTYEFPLGSYLNGGDPSYPILNERNREMYARYRELAEKEHGVIFGGRLGEYRYYAMNDIVEKFI
ncbi:MAG: UDP-galactopyranose mutase, partial [Muribaculum sp.]|nr:UDP-galactopyranose mutase [Muribaculum sp.]